MGSPCELLLETSDDEGARAACDAVAYEARRVEDKFSRYRTGNVIHQINTANGATTPVDEETARLLDFAATLHDLSGGRFDITSGALRAVWRFDGAGRLPEPDSVAAALERVGWDKVDWDGRAITLRPGMEIDLGGIGKEYAVDRCVGAARAITSAPVLVNFGGDLAVSGPPVRRPSWKVAVEGERPDVPRHLVDLRRGALARVAGGGIHFSDEIYKNKKDLVQVYLGVIQNRNIEIDRFKWPIDTLIVATSNNSEFHRFLSEKEEAPIVDRCRICYVSHNTNYKLQKQLTDYAIGSETRTTLTREDLHQDPNLNYATSIAVVLSRLPRSEKLTPVETMKLSAGEVAGEKSIKTLAEVIDTLNQDPEIINRFGQKGLGQRNLGRAIQLLIESSETNEGQCMFANDVFKALDRIILDYVTEANDRTKYLEDLKTAKGLYRERIMTEMFNAYMDEPFAIRKDVMNYVNMIIGIDAENLGPDKMWKYKDPQTGELRALKIDERYINSVEERLGLKSEEQRESFRTSIRKIYGQKISVNPDYDFMDNLELVKAVTDVRLKSDIAGAGSLIGALANRTNEENQNLYDRMIDTMLEKLGYCKTCAQKTIEYFCTQEDEK